MRSGRADSTVLSIGILLVAMSSFQLGGAFAKQLFPAIGPMGAASLRLLLSSVMLWAVSRPWRGPVPAEAIGPLLGYGVSLAGLNLFFYLALQRIPLGLAVAIDFIGPLALAILHSRKWTDAIWAALAAIGITLLFPLGGAVARLDPVGVLFCLLSAACWALYIVFGTRLGSRLPSGRATALGLAIAAVCVLPFGLFQAGGTLFSWSVLPLAAAVALLSSALPYNLEMIAMKRLPTRVFGVLMSLEPGFGALYGRLILGEHLTLLQQVAIGCVIVASAGVTWAERRVVPAIDV